MPKKMMIYIGVAGAIGLGTYLILRGREEHHRRVGTMITRHFQEPPLERIDWIELILGQTTDYIERSKELEARIKARGKRHHDAWKRAVRSEWSHYAAEVPGGTQCFETATGKAVPMNECSRMAIVAAALEGS